MFKWKVLAIFAVAILFFGACAPKATPEPQVVKETVVVEVEKAVTATPAPPDWDESAPIKVWADTARQMQIEAFMKAYPEKAKLIEIIQDDRGLILQKLLLYNNVGGGWPDVYFGETVTIRQAYSPAYDFFSADLTDWIPQEKLDEYFPGANAPCISADGKVICIRNDIAPNVLFYNVPKMKEFGYEIPETWEEFEELAAIVAKDHPDYSLGQLDNWAAHQMWYWGAECPMMQPISPTAFRVNFMHPNCQRVSEFLDRMLALGVLDTSGTFSEAYVERMKSGNWLLHIGPVWEADYIFKGVYYDPTIEANHGVVGIALLPKWANQTKHWTSSVGGGAWTMSRHTKNPKLAAEFITFVTSDIQTQKGVVTLSGHQEGGMAWGEGMRERNEILDPTQDPWPIVEIAAASIWPDFKEGPPNASEVFAPIFADIQAGNRTCVDAAEDIQAGLVQQVEMTGYEVITTGP